MKEIIIEDGDDIDAKLDATGLDPEARARLKQRIEEVSRDTLDTSAYLCHAVSLQGYLHQSMEIFDGALLEAFKAETRADREALCHDLLHIAIDRFTQMVEEVVKQLPCQRDPDEMPEDCTKH